MKRRVMIVEDDEIFLRPLRRTLEVAGFDVLALSSGEEAVDALKREDVDVVMTDKRLPGMDGVELVRRIKTDHPDVAVVMMTAYGTIESAVEAMRLGAANYLVKPFDTAELLIVLRHAIEFHELRAASRATLRRNQERFTLKNALAQSAAMREVFEVLRSVADLDTTLLIHGETGVGKELLARSVHFSGARRDKPFVPVNCAAIPTDLFESELFGFRKGAFTGAAETRRGLLQSASGGTLLLDEIGEMPLGLQSKLLRVIEDKCVTPIGSDRAVEIDVRFIATTNKDLRAEVERNAFRPDLFYRLSVMPIRVPPLREREGDVPLLARHFLKDSARRSKKPVRDIAPEAMQALCRYGWPGNVRELENVIERGVILARGDTIVEVERFLGPESGRPGVDLSLSFRDAKARVVEEFERAYIGGVLEASGGKLTAAAKHADMDPKNFSEKLVRYGMRRTVSPDSGESGAGPQRDASR
jgi:DNA-binding NtrC family response regulator